ncbi:MAG: diacylglycerol kinase family protein [bacterium]|nr:diacylglycerol kinase family protein [bacterium]
MRFLRSFRFALRGLWSVYRSEQNFRIQLVAFVVALGIGAVLGIRSWELIALVLAGGVVLVLECINSAVERLLDLVQPRLHGYVREIKDIMAAAVLVASVASVIIGLTIFLPYLLRATS